MPTANVTHTGPTTFQSGIIFDPSTLTDAQATRMGLKQYLADKAGGTNDIAYNNGNKATLTAEDNLPIAISTVKGAVLIPYQMQNGAWRLKVNINITIASAERTNCSVYINGVTTKGGPHQAASACQISSASGGVVFSLVYPNSAGRIQAAHASVTTSEYVYSADFELESKPTWAY